MASYNLLDEKFPFNSNPLEFLAAAYGKSDLEYWENQFLDPEIGPVGPPLAIINVDGNPNRDLALPFTEGSVKAFVDGFLDNQFKSPDHEVGQAQACWQAGRDLAFTYVHHSVDLGSIRTQVHEQYYGTPKKSLFANDCWTEDGKRLNALARTTLHVLFTEFRKDGYIGDEIEEVLHQSISLIKGITAPRKPLSAADKDWAMGVASAYIQRPKDYYPT